MSATPVSAPSESSESSESSGPVPLVEPVGRSRTGPARVVLLAAYLLVVGYLLAPVVLGSIGADDQVWVLRYPAINHGSALHAYWHQIEIALQFRTQDRATALAFAERQALAVSVMNLSVALAAPPVVFWALTKTVLIGLNVLAARVLLQGVRFRRPDGTLGTVSRRTVGYATLAMPLLTAAGVKAQNLGGFNGWTFYPTLCLGLFPTIVLVTVAAMRLSGPLQRNFPRLVAPVLVLFVLWGVVVAFSFELLVVAVPTVGVAMLLHPRPVEGSVVRRWRAPFVIAGGFGIGWAASYVAIKAAIGSRSCAATDSCYSGTVIDLNARTIANNFGASLPIGTSSISGDQARRLGVPFPDPSASSIGVGVLAVLLLVALLLVQRRRYAALAVPRADPREARALVTVAVLVLVVALTSAVITGITERAVQTVVDLRTAYHVGPVVWTSLALLAVLALRALWLSRVPGLGLGATALGLVLVVVVLAVMVPRNQLSAQVNQSDAVFSDFLHREVAVGQPGDDADARRCSELRSSLAGQDRPYRPAVQRLLSGAYTSFELYHHQPFCRAISRQDLSPDIKVR